MPFIKYFILELQELFKMLKDNEKQFFIIYYIQIIQ